jgi:hypothetical protein
MHQDVLKHLGRGDFQPHTFLPGETGMIVDKILKSEDAGGRKRQLNPDVFVFQTVYITSVRE